MDRMAVHWTPWLQNEGADGKRKYNRSLREAFAPFFAQGTSMGHMSAPPVRSTGPQGRGSLVRRYLAIIVLTRDFLHCTALIGTST